MWLAQRVREPNGPWNCFGGREHRKLLNWTWSVGQERQLEVRRGSVGGFIAVFSIPPLPIAEGQPNAYRHHAQRRQQQNENRPVQALLRLRGRRLRVVVAH